MDHDRILREKQDKEELKRLIKKYPDEARKNIRALPSNISGLSSDETMRRIQLGEGLENIPEKEKSKGICTEIRP